MRCTMRFAVRRPRSTLRFAHSCWKRSTNGIKLVRRGSGSRSPFYPARANQARSVLTGRTPTTSYLPDLNVWLALTWASHLHAKVAAGWFDSLDNDEIQFCRFTQVG